MTFNLYNFSHHTITMHSPCIIIMYIFIRKAFMYKDFICILLFLLIDDIKTTGATLDECTRQLLFSGAHHVYCACALATTFEKNPKKER